MKNFLLTMLIIGVSILATEAIAEESIFSEPMLVEDNILGGLYDVAALPDGGIVFVGTTKRQDMVREGEFPSPLAVCMSSDGKLCWRVEPYKKEAGTGSFAIVGTHSDGRTTCITWGGQWIVFNGRGELEKKHMEPWDANTTFLLDNDRWISWNVGTDEKGNTNALMLTLMYDNGEEAWKKTYKELADWSLDILITELSDGGFLLIGRQNIGTSQCFVTKLNAKGELLSLQEIANCSYSQLIHTGDGSAIAIGEVWETPNDPIHRITRFNIDGRIAFERDIPLGEGSRFSNIIKVDDGYLVQCTNTVVFLDEYGFLVKEWSHPMPSGQHIIYGLLVNTGEHIYLVAEINNGSNQKCEANPLVVYEISLPSHSQ